MKKKIYISFLIIGIIVLLALFATVFLSIFPRCGGTSYGGNSPTCECVGLKLNESFPWGPIYCVGIRTKCYAFSDLHPILQKDFTQDKNTTVEDIETFLKKLYTESLTEVNLQEATTTITSTGMIKTGKYKIVKDYTSEKYQVENCVGGVCTYEDKSDNYYFKYNTEVTCQSYDAYFDRKLK